MTVPRELRAGKGHRERSILAIYLNGTCLLISAPVCSLTTSPQYESLYYISLHGRAGQRQRNPRQSPRNGPSIFSLRVWRSLSVSRFANAFGTKIYRLFQQRVASAG